MSECKNCGRLDCPTLTMPTDAEIADSRWNRNTLVSDGMKRARERALANCRHFRMTARALAAEAKLAQLAEAGTGYSQQTVDAIVKERDALRERVAMLENDPYACGGEYM